MGNDTLQYSLKGDRLREDLLRHINSGAVKVGDIILPLRKLAEKYGVSYLTAQRVVEELDEKGILKRFQGKGTFVVGKPDTGQNSITVVTHDSTSLARKNNPLAWFATANILEGIKEEAPRYGFTLKMAVVYEERRKSIDDQSIIMFEAFPSEIEALKGKKIPYVIVNPIDARIRHPKIICDDSLGTHQAAIHLLSLGYRKIAYFGPHKDNIHFSPRYQGFLSALSELEIKPRKQIVEDTGDSLNAYIAMSDYLKENALPEAIVAATDLRAIGVMKALARRGIKVPEDVAIVGFDDIEDAALASPPLTTIAKPRKEIGCEAVRFIAAWLHNPDRTPPSQVLLKPRLVIRESCGAKLRKAAKKEVNAKQVVLV